MADEHRRVEARPTIAGTGMASDPERIESLEHDYERRVRASLPKHGPDFGEVLAHAPALDPEEELDPSEPDVEAKDRDESDTPSETAEDENESSLPRVPPDPRMAALHQQFATPAAVPAPVSPSGSKRSPAPETSKRSRAPRPGRSSSEKKS